MEKQRKFAGDKKVGMSFLGPLEKKLVQKCVPLIPKGIETYHLTLLTIPTSLFIILFSALANVNMNFLWLVSLMIFWQYITDLFDGALGRYRNTGLIKWGYYMDHFLDYIFLCSILIGYSILLPAEFQFLQFCLLGIFGAFMVNSFLSFAATNEFRISYLGIGPTEVRLAFILVNTFLILFGKTYMGITLPFILGLSLVGLAVTVYHTQKQIWDLDMKAKKK